MNHPRGCYKCLFANNKTNSVSTVSNICLQCLDQFIQSDKIIEALFGKNEDSAKRLPWSWCKNEQCDLCFMYKFVLKVDTCLFHHPNPKQANQWVKYRNPQAKL